MKIKRLLFAILSLFLLQNNLSAQDKLNIKFGKIAPEDFDLSKYKYDSGASAVIIADVGNTSFEGNSKGNFTLIFKRYTRIKILNKSGFDAATENIYLHKNSADEERVSDLKAVTYNLENGNIISTKLDEKSIFTDQLNKYYFAKKFTLPAVKEGSIIEVSYTIKSISGYYQFLRSWSFQGDYPCLWSEYQATIPQFFNYVVSTQGDQSFFVHTTERVGAFYAVHSSNGAGAADDVLTISGNAFVSRWVKKDVPAMKEEAFTTTIRNHLSRIEFQLHYIQYGDENPRHDMMGNWFMASEKLLADEDFGEALNADNFWMDDDIKTITAGCTNNLEKIKKTYAYIRDNFTCTNHDAIYTNNPIKTVFKTKNGNVAGINLLLTAMLRHENISAEPLLLSTRDNGYPSDTYPLMERFNYVICAATESDKTYYLDASEPLIGFNHLPTYCYNGNARVINKEKPYTVSLDADSLKEQSMTSVIIINDDKGHPAGSFQSTQGLYESYVTRGKIKKKSEKEFFKDLQTAYGSDIKIENIHIDSLSLLEYPVKISYDFDLGNDDADIIYFNPMMSENYKENPFKSADRKYPVEIPYIIDDIYTCNMEIPKGYTVEELPKSSKVAYNEKEGYFEYLIQKNDLGVQMRVRLKLNKTFFLPDEYNTLRDFFAYIVKKEGEQIVFKKIK